MKDETSPITFHVTDLGPKSPGSFGYWKVSSNGSGAWLKSPTAVAVRRAFQPENLDISILDGLPSLIPKVSTLVFCQLRKAICHFVTSVKVNYL